MKKNVKRNCLRLVVIAGLVTIILIVRMIIINWGVFASNMVEIFQIVTEHSIKIGLISLFLIITGFIVHILGVYKSGSGDGEWLRKKPWIIFVRFIVFMLDVNRHKISSKLMDKLVQASIKWGWILIHIGISLLAVDLIFIFSHFEILSSLFFTLGVICIMILMFKLPVLIIKKSKKKDSNYKLFAKIIFFILLASFFYYLDCFLFSWNNPQISLFGNSVLILFIVFLIVRKLIKKIIHRHRRRQQDKEYFMKTLALTKELEAMSLYEAFNAYIKDSLNKQIEGPRGHLPYLRAIEAIGPQALTDLERVVLIRLAKNLNPNFEAEVMRAFASKLDPKESELFIAPSFVKDLPIFFHYSRKKIEIIEVFINNELKLSWFFNKIKREFKLETWQGSINILIFSYKQEEDEEKLKLILKKFQELAGLAADCAKKVWNKEQSKAINTSLKNVYNKLLEIGVKIELPIGVFR